MKNAGQPPRPGVPAAREALCRRQRLAASTTTGPSRTDTGDNLLEPGRHAHATTCAVPAVPNAPSSRRWTNTRSCCACPWPRAGNDHRLGANEAPPAIISMFLGDELTAPSWTPYRRARIHASRARCHGPGRGRAARTSCKDNTDRNRTSPFAFTGNKFEFRMPGSAVNLSDCNMILNTAMAKSLKGFADAMEGRRQGRIEAPAIAYIKETLVGAPAHHLQRQRLLRRVAGRGRAPGPGQPPHHRRRAAVPRGAPRASRCSRSSACSPSPRCAAATR